MKKNVEKYHKTKIDIVCDLLVKVVLPCIVIGIMLLITFTSHASGEIEETPQYPLIIDSTKNPTDISIDEIKNAFINMWGDLPESYIIYCNSIDQSYKNGPHGWDYYDYYNFIVAVEPIFEYPLTLDVNSSFYYETNTIEYSFNYYTHSSSFSAYQVNSNVRHQRAYYYIVQGFGYILEGTEEDYTSTLDVVVWAHAHEVTVMLGHATPPDEFNTPVYTQGHSRPDHVPPTITVNNYTWSTYTPPTVDNSTLEKLLESLTDIVKYNANYLKDNLHNEFTNLINNIKNLIDYIGQTIQYYGDLIIENIQNSITTFYNNMVSLFEPISVAIDYISQPLQVEEVVTAIESTNIHTDVTSVVNLSNTAFGIFGTVSEPSSFTIPLDLTGIAILHQTQPFYIDLSWINSAKTYIRAFMWCIVTFGLLYSIVIGIPTMLKDSK